MKRLFTLLAALMLTLTASFAQQNFYFWGKNGNVSTEPISQVDSLTFNVGGWLFQISKPVSLGATTSAFQGTAKVALNAQVKSIDVSPEVGICYSDENSTPTYNDFKKVLGSTMQDYSFTVMDVDPGTTYYYRTYVKLLDEVYYSAVNIVTTLGEKLEKPQKPQSKVINGHTFVDLGLPSGLLWAETNVGASSAADDGDYFAWGETESKFNYDWSSYKWGSSPSKYNSSDGKNTLEAADDAATVNWGTPCRMPDSSEFQELFSKCDWSLQGRGYLVTGPNGNTIFFPTSFNRFYDVIYYKGSVGYWSRSLESNTKGYACYFYFGFDSESSKSPASDLYRYYGFPIRPVAGEITKYVQQNIFIWKDGNISVKSASETDSITSSIDSRLFNIRTSATTSVTTNTLEASVSVAFANNVRSLSQTPEVGVCFSSTNATPTYADDYMRLGSSVRSYEFILYDLDPGTTYYYRAYVKLGDEVFYGDVKSVMTFGEKPSTPSYTIINGHKFVDLGLPSGLLWARTNVGAAFSSDDGDYFAWGETEPKTTYSWSTYKWGCNPSKYNSSDSKKVLDAADDAATVNWGAPCRMPSMAEFQELYTLCVWSWKSSFNGASGYLITGLNGNTIFFPASGLRDDYNLNSHGSYGDYWSSSLFLLRTDYARNLNFGRDDVSPTSHDDRYFGFSVRPVAEK